MYQKDNCMTAEKIGFKIVLEKLYIPMLIIYLSTMETTHSLYRAHLNMLDFPISPRFDQWTDELSDYFINMQFVKYISGWFDFRVDFLTKYLFLNFLYCYTTNK